VRLSGLAFSAVLVCVISSLLAAGQTATPPPDGPALYAEHCAMCHDGEDSRAPDRDALHHRAPQAIVDALTSGSMKYQGMPLNGLERRAIAVFVTGRPLRAADSARQRERRTLQSGRAVHRPRRVAVVERLESDAGQSSLPERPAIRSHSSAGAAVEAEMGIRIS
jgi:hypothetical protein